MQQKVAIHGQVMTTMLDGYSTWPAASDTARAGQPACSPLQHCPKPAQDVAAPQEHGHLAHVESFHALCHTCWTSNHDGGPCEPQYTRNAVLAVTINGPTSRAAAPMAGTLRYMAHRQTVANGLRSHRCHTRHDCGLRIHQYVAS